MIRKVFDVIGTVLSLGLEAPFRPRWAYHRARGYLYHYVLDKQHQRHVDEYPKKLMAWQDAVRYVTDDDSHIDAWKESALLSRMIVRNRWVTGFEDVKGGAGGGNNGPIGINYGPSPVHMRLVNQVCRQLQPKHVVEAGVGRGFASASVLDALHATGRGHLHSIELPGLRSGYKEQVGEMIPDELRENWTLHFGPSAVVLPNILAEIPALDVYVHDSGANYDNQMTEFSLAVDKMRSGSVLIAGQLNNDAFFEVAEGAKARWASIDQGKPYPIGILAIP